MTQLRGFAGPLGPRRPSYGVAAFAAAMLSLQISAAAHEGHAALPSKGATVQGNHLMVTAKALRSLGVELEKVTLRDLRRVVRARARVELPWYQQAMIASLVPGRVERTSVRPGEPIKAGMELARLESLELEDFQRDLLKADAELVLTQKIVEQRVGLGKLDAVAGVTILHAKHKRDEAATDVVVATQKLLALGIDRNAIRRLRETKRPVGVLTIKSPIDGVISEADVRGGQVVSTDQHLYHIVDTSKVSIVAEVLEADIASVKVGMPMRAEFPTLKLPVEGRVDHVHPALDLRSRIREAVAHVANPGGVLKPGQSGRVEIEVGKVEQAIACPGRALINSPGGPFVLIGRAAGRFERRKVTTGVQDGAFVEIRDGLFPGDQVVVVGRQMLAAMFHVEAQVKHATLMAAPGDNRPATGRIEIQGAVEIQTEAKHRISPRLEGRLIRILVEPGQRVEAGQVVAEIDSLPLRNLQLEFLRARLEREWTGATVARLRDLVTAAVAARRELWEREAELVVIDTELANLRAKLLAVGLPPEHFTRLGGVRLGSEPEPGIIASAVPLRAGGGGIVSDFDVMPGQVVRPSDTLFEVQEPANICVRGYAFEREALSVRVGDAVSLTFPALPGRAVPGKVVRLAPLMGAGERVLPVWIEAPNLGGILPEGASAKITLETRPTPQGNVADRRP